MNLTLFDLDHTLLPLDSDYAWGQFTCTQGWVDPLTFTARNDAFYAQYQAGELDIHAYVRFATEAIRQQGAAVSIAARQTFMGSVVLPAIFPQVLSLLQSHAAQGDAMVVVTATNEFVTRPICTALGIDTLIAIELERADRQHGWYTGEIHGTPSFREGKVTRVTEWLALRGLTLADVNSTFYSDSINDLPLLERVNHPVATNPDARLRAIALARGWRILDLFPGPSTPMPPTP